jgi:hypothetical protein
VRTTLAIDDDLLAAAKAMASQQGRSMGEVVSDLLRQAMRPDFRSGDLRNGVPLLPLRQGSVPVTLKLVNALRDEAS